MTKKDFEKLFLECIQSLKQQVFVPHDTGNLKFNAIMWRWHGNTFTIYIDEKVAPYVYFTNERWERGRNPNERWIDKAVNYIARYIANRLNGEMKR